ncbi:MAG: MgtC/SapB family protein [Oligoflexia bacterium]|nr:MgtC/SapB family protein [Oligoflexia bacterium]
MRDLIPADAQKIVLVLLLSFLIGLEHEEHRPAVRAHYLFGGVRTFPLLGILGYTAALISPSYPAILSVGLGAVGALMFLSFQHKLKETPTAGITSEASGMLTFLLGAVIYEEHFWIATTLVVIGVLLLELKTGLEGLAKRIAAAEILTFTKFLLLSAVILPILPDLPLTRFQFNPQKAWLVVVAISGISYAGYTLERLVGDRGIILSAVLGSAYSSTATTIALSKRSREQRLPRLYSGSILVGSGVMYIRLAILVSIFSTTLRTQLALLLCLLGGAAILFGFLWAKPYAKGPHHAPAAVAEKNPLEVHSALLFAALFLGLFMLTHLILERMGSSGLYGLSFLTGITDVDPFILGLTQSAGQYTPVNTAIIGILIAAASNNLAKGAYALGFSDRETGKLSFTLLAILAAVGIIPIFYFGR